MNTKKNIITNETKNTNNAIETKNEIREEIKMEKNTITAEMEAQGKKEIIKNEKGFTTIELLVVLAILIVLAAMFRDEITEFAKSLFADITSFNAHLGS